MFDYKDDNCRVYNSPNTPPSMKTPQMQYAQAYVPFQRLTTIYPPDKALERGTVFPDLDMPYTKKK